MELDKEKIKKRFSEINEALAEVQKLTERKNKDLLKEKVDMAALKYYLLQAIESVGSICTHVAAKKFNKGVSSFGECFDFLEKERILEESLASKLKKMVQFRNKLTHRYWEIDDEKILEYARKDLGDFREFIKTIDILL